MRLGGSVRVGTFLAVALGTLAQGGCMTASFVSQAFVEPGPPVVTGLVSAQAAGAAGAAAGQGERLLVRYVVRDPIIAKHKVLGSYDHSLYGAYDFAVPLDAAGRPAAPYHYAGAERTADRIVADLPPEQLGALRRARLRRVGSVELRELAGSGRISDATHPDFRWEVVRGGTGPDGPVVILAYWPRTAPGEGAPSASPPGTPQDTIPHGATVLLLPATQPRPPQDRLIYGAAAVAGPLFTLPADLIFTPLYLSRQPPRSMPEPPAPAVGVRHNSP